MQIIDTPAVSPAVFDAITAITELYLAADGESSVVFQPTPQQLAAGGDTDSGNQLVSRARARRAANE